MHPGLRRLAGKRHVSATARPGPVTSRQTCIVRFVPGGPWVMRAQDTTSPVEMTWIGIGLAVCGMFAVLIGLEVIAVPGGRANLHGPLWLATLIGVIVLCAGAACVIQGIGRANARAELPADSPLW